MRGGKEKMNTEGNNIYQLMNASELSAEQELDVKNPLFDKLASEGCESYFDYVQLLGLADDTELISLSSSHHYYYDPEDLKEVKAVVNLKQLNKMEQVRDFLQNINLILSQRTYFIGSFTDSKSRTPKAINFEAYENGITSKIPLLNWVYNIIDSRTDRYLTKRMVRLMLEDAGLKVLDMTELNGLTYFCTNKEKAIA